MEKVIDTTADFILARFGAGAQLARLLGLPASTVNNWRVNGWIPAKHQARILALAEERGLDVTAADFIRLRPATAAIEEAAE